MQNNKMKQQSGAALVISLLILTVLTILGLSSMRTASMEELMARNTRDYKIAFEASDSALNEGSEWVDKQTSLPKECGSLTGCGGVADKVYRQDILGDLSDTDTTWWTSDSNTNDFLTSDKDIPEAKTDPRMAMESTFVRDSLRRGFNPPTGVNVFRVSGRGTGIKDTTEVISQQTVVKRFN